MGSSELLGHPGKRRNARGDDHPVRLHNLPVTQLKRWAAEVACDAFLGSQGFEPLQRAASAGGWRRAKRAGCCKTFVCAWRHAGAGGQAESGALGWPERVAAQVGSAFLVLVFEFRLWPAGISRLVGFPNVFRRLPRALQHRISYRAIRPAGTGWQKPYLA